MRPWKTPGATTRKRSPLDDFKDFRDWLRKELCRKKDADPDNIEIGKAFLRGIVSVDMHDLWLVIGEAIDHTEKIAANKAEGETN